ncbi:MAG: glycosyltransferase family 87 protein [Dongiaceae bacterium]
MSRLIAEPLRLLRKWVDQPPARAILAFLIIQQCGINLFSLYSHQTIYYVNRLPYPGYDFMDFYNAARDHMEGLDAYLRLNFNKPPLVIFLFTPLAYLDKITALHAYFVINCLLIACALFVALRATQMRYGAALFAIAALYYPVHFQVERGNLESIIMVCLAVLVFRSSRALEAGLALGIAIVIKLYPAALLAPMFLLRLYRQSIVALLVAIATVLALYPLWRSAISGIAARPVDFILFENTSIFAPFSQLGALADQALSSDAAGGRPVHALFSIVGFVFGAILCLLLLILLVVPDLRRFRAGSAAGPVCGSVAVELGLYIPVLLAVPLVVISYAQINLLLLIPLAQLLNTRLNPGFLTRLLFQAGMVGTSVQWLTWWKLWGLHWPMAMPGCGLALLMLWAVRMKWALARGPVNGDRGGPAA